MKKNSRSMIVFLCILSFLAGIVGSFIGIAVVSSSVTMRQMLGISTNNSGFPVASRVENITVKEDSGVIHAVKEVTPSVVSIIYTKDVEDVSRMVDEGSAQAGFLMNAVNIQQLKKIALNGEKMPPKTTYFYPKLLSGLTVSKFD